MTVYPVKPDGSVLLTAYAQFSLDDVAEMKGSTSTPNPCLSTKHTVAAVKADGALALALNLSTACCETTFTTGSLPGNVSRDMIIVNVTRPDWPANFYAQVTVSFAASRVVIENEAEPGIQGAYNITYEYVKEASEVALTEVVAKEKITSLLWGKCAATEEGDAPPVGVSSSPPIGLVFVTSGNWTRTRLLDVMSSTNATLPSSPSPPTPIYLHV